MSSTRSLLNEFLIQFYDLDKIKTRILSGHERLVKETREVDFMLSNTFASDENPNYRWMAAMSGEDPNWHTKPGSSWIFGRNKELTNYRNLLGDPTSGLLGVWSSPKHMPSLGTSVEVWEKDATMSDLLAWQEELTDNMRVSSLCNSLTTVPGNKTLFRGYHEVIGLGPDISDKDSTGCVNRKMGRYDTQRNFEGLFKASKIWREWDLNLLVQAVDQTDLLVTDECKAAVEVAMNYRWKECPEEVVTDSEMLAKMFDTWEHVPVITNEHRNTPVIFLSDKLRAEHHVSETLKTMVLIFKPKGGISNKKLLSGLKPVLGHQFEDPDHIEYDQA